LLPLLVQLLLLVLLQVQPLPPPLLLLQPWPLLRVLQVLQSPPAPLLLLVLLRLQTSHAAMHPYPVGTRHHCWTLHALWHWVGLPMQQLLSEELDLPSAA
jgi:hypothetical protein